MNTVPRPALTISAWRMSIGAGLLHHRQPLPHCINAAGMIAIAVRQQQPVQASLALRQHERHDHGLARIESARKSRACVIQEHMILRAHQHGQTLPHIQHAQLERRLH